MRCVHAHKVSEAEWEWHPVTLIILQQGILYSIRLSGARWNHYDHNHNCEDTITIKHLHVDPWHNADCNSVWLCIDLKIYAHTSRLFIGEKIFHWSHLVNIYVCVIAVFSVWLVFSHKRVGPLSNWVLILQEIHDFARLAPQSGQSAGSLSGQICFLEGLNLWFLVKLHFCPIYQLTILSTNTQVQVFKEIYVKQFVLLIVYVVTCTLKLSLMMLQSNHYLC